jgi:hypothetical protein
VLALISYAYRRGGVDVVCARHEALFREAGRDTSLLDMQLHEYVPSEWAGRRTTIEPTRGLHPAMAPR